MWRVSSTRLLENALLANFTVSLLVRLARVVGSSERVMTLMVLCAAVLASVHRAVGVLEKPNLDKRLPL